MTPCTNPKSRWEDLLINNALVRNYELYSRLDMVGATPDTPLDDVLPGLLIIRSVAMLDEIIKEYVEARELPMPKGYRTDLNGRINYLRDINILNNYEKLHSARKIRNRLAHDSSEQETWKTYDNCIEYIHEALRDIGITSGELASYTCSAERTHLDVSVEEEEKGILLRKLNSVFVHENDTVVAKHSWSSELHRRKDSVS